MKHMRREGLSDGYFCCTCGGPCGTMGHNTCTPNKELVKELEALNAPCWPRETRETPKGFFDSACEELEK